MYTLLHNQPVHGMQVVKLFIKKLFQTAFSYILSPGTYYIMGNIVEQLAFIPPDRPQAHEDMKVQNKSNLHWVTNALGHQVALLWFDFDAEYTILYSHGNAEDLAGSKATFIDLATYLECNFCAYDYSGYGLSEGQCSEKACYTDIESVYRFLTDEKNIPSSKIIVFGRSLGSGPTTHLASKQSDLAGMILQSPLRTAIKTQMPDWVGYVFKKIDIFTNEDKVPHIKTFPVMIIHGTEDTVVPYTHGEHLHQLLQAANEVKERVVLYAVQGCGHNDIEYRRGREFKRNVKRFITEQIKTRTYAMSSDEDQKADDEDDVYEDNRRRPDLGAVHTDSTINYTAPSVQDVYGLNSVDSNSDKLPSTPNTTTKDDLEEQ